MVIQLFGRPTEAELNSQAEALAKFESLEMLKFDKQDLEYRIKREENTNLNDLLVEHLYIVTKAIELIEKR